MKLSVLAWMCIGLPGFGFLEAVYKDAMQLEFAESQVSFLREDDKGKILKHKFMTDFTVSNNIIVEAKANKEGMPNEAVAQTLNYLEASGFKLGVLINFGKIDLVYKRLIF